MSQDRRDFLKTLGISALGVGALSIFSGESFASEKKSVFRISLAQWSFHQSLFSGKMSNMDFPLKAKKDFGIDIVEYVSVFFNKKETDSAYVKELGNRTSGEGIMNHLIMVDGEGDLGNLNVSERKKAVENHYKWVDTARKLGCKTIRVNAAGQGGKAEVRAAVVDGLGQLTEYGKKNNINIVVENHGGYSSDGKWLSGVIHEVNSPYCGTLPDFGNFRISKEEEYDKYLGVKELLPYAKGISTKTYDFDVNGNETTIDYDRMFGMIKGAGWSGILGVEYEGSRLSEDDGIIATKKLLERMMKA